MVNTTLCFSNRSELKKYLKEKYNATDRDFIIFNANLGTTLFGLDTITCFYYMRIFGSARQKRICNRFIELLRKQGAIDISSVFTGAFENYFIEHLDIFSEYNMKVFMGGKYASHKPIW